MTAPGDFSYLTDEFTRTTYEDMYAAITKAEAWDWIKAEPQNGFMFDDSEKSKAIGSFLNGNDRVGHSGASYGLTMRAMQQLALIGWECFTHVQTAAATKSSS